MDANALSLMEIHNIHNILTLMKSTECAHEINFHEINSYNQINLPPFHRINSH